MHLTAEQVEALKSLCRVHIQRARKPSTHVIGALEALKSVPAGFPARISACSTRPLTIPDEGIRERLYVEFSRLADEVQEVAEMFGAADAGAAIPGEMLHELHDAIHTPGQPDVNETRALGLSS